MSKRRRASSRVVKREKQRLFRQTVIFIGIAIAIVLLFILVILPGFIRAVTSFLNSPGLFEQQDTLPPQPPVISAPLDATTSANLSISGYGEPNADVTLVLNGSEKIEDKISEDGEFSIPIVLEEGENIIQAFATDEAENESNLSRSYIISLDTEDPVIDLEQPEDGAAITGRDNQDYEIKGSTEPGAQIYINDRSVYTNSDGSFSYRHRLNEGENEIRFRSEDRAGNDSELTIIVTFKY